MKKSGMLLTLVLGIGTLATSAMAQDRNEWRGNDGFTQVQFGRYGDSGAYNKGIRDGSNAGRQDGIKGISPIPFEHGSYRDSHNRDYRDGYLQGYRENYGRFSRGRGWYGNGGYGNGGWRDRDRNDNWGRHDHDRDWHDNDRDRDRDRDHDRDRW